MHKIFAKTLFIGKNVVFLPQCHSTNEIARDLSKNSKLSEGSIIWSDFQTRGKGQQGNTWISDSEANLLFTLYLKPEKLDAQSQFNLTCLISVVLREVIEDLIGQKTSIKWPNDIYVNDKKIAGILIETNLIGGRIDEVFIGVGLNVNQGHFHLPTATSMKMLTGNEFDRFSILEKILLTTEKYHDGIFNHNQLRKIYLDHLMWRNEEHVFRIQDQEVSGTIIGTTESGRLQVKIKGRTEELDLKQIQFIE